MKDNIHIELWDSSNRREIVRKISCAHEMDTSFESCWPMADGYLKKISLKPGFAIYLMDWDPGTGFTMNASVQPAGFGFKFFISGKMKYQNCAVKQGNFQGNRVF